MVKQIKLNYIVFNVLNKVSLIFSIAKSSLLTKARVLFYSSKLIGCRYFLNTLMEKHYCEHKTPRMFTATDEPVSPIVLSSDQAIKDGRPPVGCLRHLSACLVICVVVVNKRRNAQWEVNRTDYLSAFRRFLVVAESRNAKEDTRYTRRITGLTARSGVITFITHRNDRAKRYGTASGPNVCVWLAEHATCERGCRLMFLRPAVGLRKENTAILTNRFRVLYDVDYLPVVADSSPRTSGSICHPN